MIIPTTRAVLLTSLAAPVALALGIVAPGGWALVLPWIGVLFALIALDALLAAPAGRARLTIDLPASMGVGETIDLRPSLARADGTALSARFAADVGPPLEPARELRFHAVRRGRASVRSIWARRVGPLGLAVRQMRRRIDRDLLVLPDIRPVRDRGMRQFLQSQQAGLRLRRDSGDGQDFQLLTRFQTGMERRTVDWKASARHAELLAREFQTERDNAVVFALDAGRSMIEPVAGMPRIDRAVSAALLAAFVALKSGDRVRLFSFAARPHSDSGSVSGTDGFARLHRTAAEIDYRAEESNYTLSLVSLDAKLERRSLVVLFTEFTDPTSAELMLAAAGRMLKRHRVLFVLFRDEELETMFAADPASADDVVRATVAHTLLRERRIVIERLRRLGVEVIETAPDAMPLALVERYAAYRERSA